jgi:lipoprotein-anchoring transpeptidase ErfK/SrfK
MKRIVTWPALCAVAMLALAGGGPAEAGNTWRVPRNHGPSTKYVVNLTTNERSGTIIISTAQQTLDVVLDSERVTRYRIGVGRDGFTWAGTVTVGAKAEWPSWRPPAEMRQRDPNLPKMVPPGPHNPLGARALYLFKSGADTLYRIHGTNETDSIGGNVSSGCFRLTNTDILELYNKIPVGTKVIVR